MFGIPLRQMELTVLAEQVQVGVPVLGIAQLGLAVEELLDAVLQLRIHGFTSFSLRACCWCMRSRPLRRNFCQLPCWLT
ncbi:hypothetical protein D3C80_1963960 [compost metagenome]